MKLRMLTTFTIISRAALAVTASNAFGYLGNNNHDAGSEERALRVMVDRLDILQREIQKLRSLSQHHHKHHEPQGEADESSVPDFNTRQKQIQGSVFGGHKVAKPAATYFTLASEMTIFFPWFKTDTWESYSFALVMALSLATLLEFMNGRFQKGTFRSRSNGRLHDGGCMLLCNTFARFIAAALQYSLILIIATYDAGLFFAACGGTSIGYFFYNWLALKGPEDDNLLHSKEQPDILPPEAQKPSPNEVSSENDTPDIEQGSTQSSNGARTLTISRLETISEDDQSRTSCASTEDGGSIYSFKSSGTKSRVIPSTADEFEDELIKDSTKTGERRGSVGSSSNRVSSNTSISDDMSVGSSASRKKVTVVIKDTNDLRAKLAALQTVSKDINKQQQNGDDHSIGCRSVPAAKRHDDDRSIGNNSLRSVPVSLNTPLWPGAGKNSRGFSRGRRPRNVTLEI